MRLTQQATQRLRFSFNSASHWTPLQKASLLRKLIFPLLIELGIAQLPLPRLRVSAGPGLKDESQAVVEPTNGQVPLAGRKLKPAWH
jgi:hypothetical protein